jgi:hypothetical protein
MEQETIAGILLDSHWKIPITLRKSAGITGILLECYWNLNPVLKPVKSQISDPLHRSRCKCDRFHDLPSRQPASCIRSLLNIVVIVHRPFCAGTCSLHCVHQGEHSVWEGERYAGGDCHCGQGCQRPQVHHKIARRIRYSGDHSLGSSPLNTVGIRCSL